MMTKKICIGILGGIGPQATAFLYTSLINKIQQTGLIKSNSDYPQIIINSIPAHELFGNKNSHKKTEKYLEGLKLIDSHKPDFIAIACNTAHVYLSQFSRNISSYILDLPKFVNSLTANQEIIILASSTSVSERLFSKAASKTKSITNQEQILIDKAIIEFNAGIRKRYNISLVRSIANKYAKLDAQIILIACTELSVMLYSWKHKKKLDTLGVLIDQIISYWYSLKFSKKNALPTRGK